MMKTHNFLSTFLGVVLLFAVSQVFSQGTTDYTAQIEKLNKQMAQYMLEGNIEKNLTLYAKDAISMPSYEPMHEGINAIREASEKMASSGIKFSSFEPTTKKVIPNGNLITEIGTFKVTLTMPGMDKPMDDQGKYLTIWEKQNDGSLKIKIETWNSDTDPMIMMKSMNQQAEIDKK